MKITCTMQEGSRPGDYDYVHVAAGGVSCGTLAVLHPGGAEVVRRLSTDPAEAVASALDSAADAMQRVIDAMMDEDTPRDELDVRATCEWAALSGRALAARKAAAK